MSWNFEDVLNCEQIIYDKNMSPKSVCLRNWWTKQGPKVVLFPTNQVIFFIRKSMQRRRAHRGPIFEKDLSCVWKKASTKFTCSFLAFFWALELVNDFSDTKKDFFKNRATVCPASLHALSNEKKIYPGWCEKNTSSLGWEKEKQEIRESKFWNFFEIFENSCFFRRGGGKVDIILPLKKLFKKNFLAGFEEQLVGFLPV